MDNYYKYLKVNMTAIRAELKALNDISAIQHMELDHKLDEIIKRQDHTNGKVLDLENSRAFKSDFKQLEQQTNNLRNETSIWRYFQKRPIIFILSIIIIVLILELLDIQTIVSIIPKI